MIKTHDLKEIVVDGVAIQYFYKREQNDYYGNPRYRVYILNPNERFVTEKIAKKYEMTDWIHSYIKNPN